MEDCETNEIESLVLNNVLDEKVLKQALVVRVSAPKATLRALSESDSCISTSLGAMIAEILIGDGEVSEKFLGSNYEYLFLA